MLVEGWEGNSLRSMYPPIKTIHFQGQQGQSPREVYLSNNLLSWNPAPQGVKKTEAGWWFLWLSRTRLLAVNWQSSFHWAPQLTFRGELWWVALGPERQLCTSPPNFLFLRSGGQPAISPDGSVWPWKSADLIDEGLGLVCLCESVFTSILSYICQFPQTCDNRKEEVTGLKVK